MEEQPLSKGKPDRRAEQETPEITEFDAIAELRHVWLENFFSLDKIKEQIETCNKECKSCSKEQMLDCLLETKECVHSLAVMLKDFFSNMLSGSESLMDMMGEPALEAETRDPSEALYS